MIIIFKSLNSRRSGFTGAVVAPPSARLHAISCDQWQRPLILFLSVFSFVSSNLSSSSLPSHGRKPRQLLLPRSPRSLAPLSFHRSQQRPSQLQQRVGQRLRQRRRHRRLRSIGQGFRFGSLNFLGMRMLPYVAALPSRSVGSPRTCSATTAMPTLQVNFLFFLLSQYLYDFTLRFVRIIFFQCVVFLVTD
jgi:hypothetical protein